MGAAGRESPGGESLFLVRTRKTNGKEIAPTVCDPTLTLRATCGAQVRRGPAELAALKQLLALIRRTFRSSAQPEGGSRVQDTGDASLRSLPSRLAAHRRCWLLPSAAMAVLDPALPPLYAPRSAGFGGSGLALFEPKASLARPRQIRAPQVPLRESAGAQPVGAISFGDFSCSHKKSYSPAGAKTGQRHQ